MYVCVGTAVPGGVAFFNEDRTDEPNLVCTPLHEAVDAVKLAYYTAKTVEILLGL
jgi:hypothetical protein